MSNSIVSTKCPGCGGPLKFKPGVGFKCEYCLSKYTQEQLDALNQTATADGDPQPAAKPDAAAAADAKQGEGVIYSCPSCGAQVMTDATTAATSCHYCHNPIVLSGKLSGDKKPDKVVPFVLTKEQAAEQFRKHCEGRTFLPKDFYSEDQIENLYGVYYPYWVVDAEVDGSYTAVGNVEEITRRGDDRHVQVTSYDVERSGNVSLQDMTGAAIRSEEAETLGYILPYELSKATDFSMSYLLGFRAEMKNVEKEQLKPEIEQTKKELTRQLLRSGLSQYSSVENEEVRMNTLSEKWEYALLPVWIVTYKYADRIYMYGINGQTGKAFGELPVDKNKLTIASVLAGVAAAVIMYLILMMFGG